MQALLADNPAQVTPPTSKRSARLQWIDWLQIGIALVAVLACCRGEGHPFRWLSAALALPVGRFLAIATYRQRVLAWFRCRWQTLEYHEGKRTPWLAVAVFAVAPSLLLFLSNDRSPDTGDTWPVIPTASSLTSSGSWALDAYIGQAPAAYSQVISSDLPYSTIRVPKGIYSGYPSGMVPFAVPVTAIARLTGADLYSPKVQKHLEKWVASWVAALSVGLFFLIALRLAPPAPAYVATILLASGSVLFSTCGQNLWQHDGIIFWSMLALWIEFQPGLNGGVQGVLGQGLCCAMMVACRLSSALFVAPFGLWILGRAPKRGLLLIAASALCYAPWAWFYGSTYGSIFGPSTHQLAGGNWAWSVSTLSAVLVSPSHGALVYQPWLILMVFALVPGWHRLTGRDTPAGWSWLCLSAIVLQVLLVGGWRCWWGGHCYGSRLLSEAIPLSALLCVAPIAALWRLAGGKQLLMTLAVCAFLMHAVAVYGKAEFWHNHFDEIQHPDMLWSWSHPPFLFPFQAH
jgi:hypothetical protein